MTITESVPAALPSSPLIYRTCVRCDLRWTGGIADPCPGEGCSNGAAAVQEPEDSSQAMPG